MKQITLFTLFISYFLGTTLLKGQNLMPQIIPPSPNATALAMYSDYPVSHFTGVPDINIPLYEIKIGDYTLPISLSYHASGIMVGQEASNVGLGWVLNAGGAISRTIRCYDDFNDPISAGGYFKSPDIKSTFLDPGVYVGGTPGDFHLLRDSEPDIFYCNIPGFSGKFIIGQDQKLHFFNFNQHIEAEFGEYGEYFKLYTAEGIEYTFEDKEKTSVTTYFGDAQTKKYTSTWYLSKILLPNNQSITFEYKEEDYYSPVYTSYRRQTRTALGNLTAESPASLLTTKTNSVVNTLQLSKIIWDNGYIEFKSSAREDIIYKSTKLDRIDIYTSSGEQLKSVRFDYEYFNNNNYGNNPEKMYLYKRLKLKKVSEFDSKNNAISQPYQFEYFEGVMPEKNSSKTDMFGYYNGNTNGDFVVKAVCFDGSYNTKLGGYNPPNCLPGASMKTSFDHLRIGTLKKIIYPTGGFAEFEYEENSYTIPSLEAKSLFLETQKINLLSMGVSGPDEYEYEDSTGELHFTLDLPRILVLKYHLEDFRRLTWDETSQGANTPIAILRNENNEEIQIIKFPFSKDMSASYEDNQTFSLLLKAGTYHLELLTPPKHTFVYWTAEYDKDSDYPIQQNGGGLRIAKIKTDATKRLFKYSTGTLFAGLKLSYFLTEIEPAYDSFGHEVLYFYQCSSSALPLSSFTIGAPVGYNEVSEYLMQDEIKTETKHHFICEVEDKMTVSSFTKLTPLGVGVNYPFAPNQPTFNNGLIEKQELYINDLLVKNTDYNYVSTESKPIYCFLFSGYGYGVFLRYEYVFSWYKNNQKIVSEYFYNEEGRQKEIITVTNYDYNDTNYQINKSTTYDSESNEIIEQIKYPTDYTDAISKAMVDKHILNKPVEQITLKNGKVINAQKTQYANMQGIYLPEKIFATNLNQSVPVSTYTNHYTQEVVFEKYDEKGNIIQVRGKDGVPITYIWSYNKQYPVMEFLNATYDEVIVKLGNEITSIESDPASILSKQASLYNSLASMLPNTKMRLFTYKPLVGMTSVTDEKGITIYYEYDDAGRLIQTKDNEGKTQQSFEYHYQNN
jgi:YD repeat-containing protein